MAVVALEIWREDRKNVGVDPTVVKERNDSGLDE